MGSKSKLAPVESVTGLLHFETMHKPVVWWRNGIFFFLCLAIVLLGFGRVELPLSGVSFSSWSVSRTTFFFWLTWKVFIWVRYGSTRLGFRKESIPVPVFLFFSFVSISLLPDFREAGDYRYFFFAMMHYLMVLDLFSEAKKVRVLLLLLGLLPGILVVRGIVYDSSVLDLSQMNRFGYPLDHANTAGYVFSMSIPLAIAVIVSEKGWLRRLGIISFALEGLGLILTYSRGAWLGLGASIFFFGLVAKVYKPILFLLILGSVVLFISPPLKERLFSLVEPRKDGPINYRIQVMKDSTSIGLRNPVLGIGYGRGRLKEALRETYRGTPDNDTPIWHAHNVYVELFAGTGLLGLGAFLWLLGEATYRMLQKTYQEPEVIARITWFGVLAALVAFMVTGLGDVPFYHHETRIFFFSLLALIHIHLREQHADLDE